ncbi:ATP-binding domain-containing protein 3 [Salpingoeca rosetta]|uniref:ATP-binding domain-containing protein 3 n=1 Tax=Salpingoeca rosetta (strain ATCC 50818 / BSB-021) TaxID=946362 RepID=F2UAD5_SALR5|nr:ATP-binding domain-containing protein 3 [Salpingoeca rosetta]EGD73710.1 ATP-binding domain-containing protein 3 [Salpingoeca rosetta]|eukprot:XP_004993991.1 ATP-binding domain-containing protein 3 [Salpingoeca rosetta]
MKLCARCETSRAAMRRPKTGAALCRECFYAAFEEEVHETIVSENLFTPGDVVAIGASGGKAITTGEGGDLPRSKPFKYTYEKEIVMYAYFKKLDYFSTECTYSPNAYRGFARTFLKDLETIKPSSIIDIIHSGEALHVKEEVTLPPQGTCIRCGYMTSSDLCKACVLLEGLNKGRPKLAVGKKRHEERLRADDSITDPTTATAPSSSSSSSSSSSQHTTQGARPPSTTTTTTTINPKHVVDAW